MRASLERSNPSGSGSSPRRAGPPAVVEERSRQSWSVARARRSGGAPLDPRDYLGARTAWSRSRGAELEADDPITSSLLASASRSGGRRLGAGKPRTHHLRQHQVQQHDVRALADAAGRRLAGAVRGSPRARGTWSGVGDLLVVHDAHGQVHPVSVRRRRERCRVGAHPGRTLPPRLPRSALDHRAHEPRHLERRRGRRHVGEYRRDLRVV